MFATELGNHNFCCLSTYFISVLVDGINLRLFNISVDLSRKCDKYQMKKLSATFDW